MPEKSKNCLGKLPPFVQLYVLEADHEGILTLCFIYKENILMSLESNINAVSHLFIITGQAVTDDPVLEIEQ